VRSTDPRLRGALLMPVCALGVHQLRYYLAFGAHAQARLAHDGHAYLSNVEPFALLAVALALGGFVGRLARGRQRREPATPDRPRMFRVWLLCALALLTIYCGQELFEGAFAAGHPAGIAGILGHGGWIAVPIALAVGGVLAATLRLAETLISFAASRRRDPRQPTARAALPLTPYRVRDWRLDPSSGVVAGRAPPLTVSIS
jgi:hypothetical protein